MKRTHGGSAVSLPNADVLEERSAVHPIDRSSNVRETLASLVRRLVGNRLVVEGLQR